MNLESFISLILYGFIYLLTFNAWLWIRNYLKQNEKIRNQLIIKNRMVRNYTVFINTLEKQEKKELPEAMFILGNKDCDLELAVFTSLYCGMCQEMEEMIDRLIFAYKDEIKINILFKTHPLEEKNHFLYILHSVFLSQGAEAFLQASHFWFENKNLKPWKIADEYDLEKNKEAFKRSSEWFHQNGIISTPSVFINGYAYPHEFEKEDLYYHIEGIIENNK